MTYVGGTWQVKKTVEKKLRKAQISEAMLKTGKRTSQISEQLGVRDNIEMIN